MSRITVRPMSAVLVGLLLGATVAASPRAAPHTGLVKSEPGKNDTVAGVPKILKLWYSEPPKTGTLEVKLATAGGQAIKLAAPRPDTTVKGDNPPMIVAVQGSMAPGVYRVDWSAIAPDGDASKGTYQFTVKPKP